MPHAHYRAFISYSQHDVKWAQWPHTTLEHYEVHRPPLQVRPSYDSSWQSHNLLPICRQGVTEARRSGVIVVR
jgi:hypothetical protein